MIPERFIGWLGGAGRGVDRADRQSRRRIRARAPAAQSKEHVAMLNRTMGPLILAIIAAVFGFSDIATGAKTIAQVLFFVSLVAFVASLIAELAMAGMYFAAAFGRRSES